MVAYGTYTLEYALISAIEARQGPISGRLDLSMGPAQDNPSRLIHEIFAASLHRAPREGEIARWTRAIEAGQTAADILAAIRETKEFEKVCGVGLRVPPGHYFSPIVDPSTVRGYLKREWAQSVDDLAPVNIDTDGMLRLWESWSGILRSTNFPEDAIPAKRFFLNNTNYPFGDAAVLRATVASLAPKRIIEIGSGNSTACMLDTLEEFGLSDTRIICIEPYPKRLNERLRPQDRKRVEIVEKPVQEVGAPFFSQLGSGDILFIDSTHVLKTGSDVHYEIFHILPALQKGVIVHFHDCPFPFEYPARWIFERKWSWTEVYAVRAFLMYNAHFRVRFWNSLFARMHPQRVEVVIPRMREKPGAGLWVEKVQ